MKRFVGIGDSIVHGTSFEERFGIVENNFIKIVGEKLGFDEIINYGVNGTTVCPMTEWRPTLAMCLYVDEMLPGDLAIIAGGTNDYGRNIEIGSVEDSTDKTFYGSLILLFVKAKKRFRNVFVITPIKRIGENEKNKKGYILSDYRNAIKTKANEFEIPVINGIEINFDFKKHIPDGLHPNREGHKVYANFVINEIKKIRIK